MNRPTTWILKHLSWLEQYLQGYHGAVLIVSHDRYFLDKVVNQVYEISRHSMKKYHGNYSSYLVKRAEDYERDMKQFEKQQEEIEKLRDFVQRNITRASTTKRAQSRRKQLDKMEVLDRPLGDQKSATFSFQIDKQSGNEVLQLKELSVGYSNETISENINVRITKGESIALVGPNGVGKSTLLKTIINKLSSLSGEIRFGTNVQVSYYDQEQANLVSNKRVLNELWDEHPLKPEKEIRTILGNFLFSGDDVLKTVSTLSGGEKARLALAKMMMEKGNFLILDEPTNHLDIDSKLVLENALIDYPGTILFVSHDRYFINRIATKVIELSKDGNEEFLGDYDYYVEKKQEQAEHEALEQQQQQSKQPEQPTDKTNYMIDKEAKKAERQRKRRIEEIEIEMEKLETNIQEYNQLLCDPEVFQNHEKVLSLQTKLDEAQTVLDLLLEEWAELDN